jgi:prepilin peptidase CpaA
MNMIHPSTVLDVLLAALLLYSCVTDWRERIIPHWLNGCIALIGVATWIATPAMHSWQAVGWQLALCLAVFFVFAIFQAIGMMGGGDVKMLGALALVFPLKPMMNLLFIMAIAGGVLTLAMLVYHKMRKLAGKPEIPYGIAIAFAALIIICEHYFNHFR